MKTEIQREVGYVMVDTEIVSTSQGMPRIAGSCQRLKEARKDSSKSLQREHGPEDTLTLDF